jgi:hypothetical protein
VCGVEDGDLEAALARRGGGLGADPAGPDHDERAAVLQPLTQGVAVLDAAQVQDAIELAAGDRKGAWLGPGGEQQPVVAQPLAVVERQLARRGVQAHRRATEAKLDVVLGVVAHGVDVDLLAVDLAAQVVLGQRRSLVRALLLGADEQPAPVKAFGAQGLGAGQAGADDH